MPAANAVAINNASDPFSIGAGETNKKPDSRRLITSDVSFPEPVSISGGRAAGGRAEYR